MFAFQSSARGMRDEKLQLLATCATRGLQIWLLQSKNFGHVHSARGLLNCFAAHRIKEIYNYRKISPFFGALKSSTSIIIQMYFLEGRDES